ncbi:TIR domain-containing protein [Acutalibacter sp. 1XD8-36]|uniref:TIR domain-containing protein n=1 Tax=Acutalibacter sp. 1XD8-36 TaxID=2320852 RepID=UPI00261F288E|nr:molecular chaperone Tir [Acutalibacter sp. 1XD8-36]
MYRTKTYIAADWDQDEDAVNQLHKWNDSNYWSLSFNDAHEITKAKDSSLYCSIKSSLKTRMDASKTFILIVGDSTDTITKGSCAYCPSYNSLSKHCQRGYTVDYRSYIDYECDKAVEAGIKIVVLYKSISVNKTKCPTAVRNIGTHIPMYYKGKDDIFYWNYSAIKNALA